LYVAELYSHVLLLPIKIVYVL